MPAKPAENRNVERLASAKAGTRSSPSSTTGAGWRAERRRNTAPRHEGGERGERSAPPHAHSPRAAQPRRTRRGAERERPGGGDEQRDAREVGQARRARVANLRNHP